MSTEFGPERRHASLTPGESLKIARELQGLTQSELARASGIAQSTISALESGTRTMGLVWAQKLAEALQVHPAVLAFPDYSADNAARRHATRQSRIAAAPINAARSAKAPAKGRTAKARPSSLSRYRSRATGKSR